MTDTVNKGVISYINVDGESVSGAFGLEFLEGLLSRSKEMLGGTGIHSPRSLSGGTGVVFDDAMLHRFDTQGSSPTDSLTNIVADSGSGAVLRDGFVIGASIVDGDRIITAEHMAGGDYQLSFLQGRSKVLRRNDRWLWFRLDLDAKIWYELLPDFGDLLDRLVGTRPVTQLTVTGATVTPTTAMHTLTAATAQDLSFALQTNFPESEESSLLFLTASPTSPGAITLKHETAGDGHFVLANGIDSILGPGQTLVCRRSGNTWVEIGRLGAMPAPIQGGIVVGSGASPIFANLAAPPRNRMTLKSKLSEAADMIWTDDLTTGEIAVTGAGATNALTATSESFRTIDCTTDNNTDTLPDSTTVAGKTFLFYLKAAVGKTQTVNISAGNTIGKNLWTTTQLTNAGDLLILRSDGTANWKIIQDNRGLGGIKPLSLGKIKNFTQAAYQSMTIQMANGELLQAGLNIGLARGANDGISQFGPVQWDSVNPPPANSTIVDWVFTGSNLYVVLSNGWVYSAGQNAGGQLGQGDTTARYVLTRIPYFFNNGITVNKVWAGTNGSADATMASVYFFVTQAGINYVFACGNNAGGQLGNGNTTNQSTPVNVNSAGMTLGTKKVVDIQVMLSPYANGFAAVLLDDGTMYMTGKNVNGALGQGNTTALTEFTLVPGITGITSMKIFGTENPYQGAMAITSAAGGSLFAWGNNAQYQGSNGGTANKTSPGTAILTNVKECGFVGGYSNYGCWALKNDNTLFTWGDGANNILFGGNTTTIQSPTQKILTTVSKVWAYQILGYFTAPAIGLIVLDTNGKLHITGTLTTTMSFPVTLDSNFASGAYLASMPKELTDGSDTIADMVVIMNAGINPMVFVLTTNGVVYGCSGGVASSSPLVKGHVATNTTEPTNTYWYRLNKQLWE